MHPHTFEIVNSSLSIHSFAPATLDFLLYERSNNIVELFFDCTAKYDVHSFTCCIQSPQNRRNTEMDFSAYSFFFKFSFFFVHVSFVFDVIHIELLTHLFPVFNLQCSIVMDFGFHYETATSGLFQIISTFCKKAKCWRVSFRFKKLFVLQARTFFGYSLLCSFFVHYL